MRILVTGGTGFIGSSIIVSNILPGNIFYPSHEELDLLDLAQVKAYIKKNKIKYVIHTAVFSALLTNREEGLEHDMQMFTNIIHCSNLLNKIIYFGSGAEFDKARDLKKINEEQWGESLPTDNYGRAKYLMHKIGKDNPKVANLRLFGVFGQNEDYRFKFITNTIAKHVLRFPININQDVIFDYLDIRDLAPIVKYFLENRSNHSSYNITPTQSIKLSGILKIIDKIGKRKSKCQILNSGFNYQYTGSNERLLQEIPDLVFIPIEESISNLYQWFSDNALSLDREALMQDEFIRHTQIKNETGLHSDVY